MIDTIRDLIDRQGHLALPAASLAADQDLFEAGLTPYNGVRLMLAIEDAFEIEFPEAMLNRANFGSITAIAISVAEVHAGKLRMFSAPEPALALVRAA